jgi:uncharacterized protein (DUF433 family)
MRSAIGSHFNRDPKVCAGAWHARGTRVLLANIVDSFAEGADEAAILRSYPSLQGNHVAAARRFAADLEPLDSPKGILSTVRGDVSRRAPRPVWLDESLPAELQQDFRAYTAVVAKTCDLGLRGAPNTILMRALYDARAALISLDEGIADRRRFPPEQYAGLILLRPPTSGRLVVRNFLLSRWKELEAQIAEGCLLLLD